MCNHEDLSVRDEETQDSTNESTESVITDQSQAWKLKECSFFALRVHQPLNCISAFNLIDISSGDIIQWIELRKSFLKHNNSFFVWWCIQVDNSCTPGLSLQVIYYERMFLLPNNWWKKVTFMLFLFRDFDLICVMQSNTTPDEIAVHNLDQFEFKIKYFYDSANFYFAVIFGEHVTCCSYQLNDCF